MPDDDTAVRDEDNKGSTDDDGRGNLLPDADAAPTAAERYSKDEGRTEEDLNP